jgi:hypothetical protein
MAIALTTIAVVPAQEKEDRTLLSHEQMNAIINEASGERALHHVLELCRISASGARPNTRRIFARAKSWCASRRTTGSATSKPPT